MSEVEQADGYWGAYHKYIKKSKNRLERRRAKEGLRVANLSDVDIISRYGKYSGYEL